MRLQYIGDSKDSFKWDYLHCITSELKYSLLNIALMMTSDDDTSHGNTEPKKFSDEILEFCKELKKIKKKRANNDKKYFGEFIQKLEKLPEKFNAGYKIKIHKGFTYFTKNNRDEYFEGFNNKEKQIVFVDPNTGLEPKKSDEKHITYTDVERISEQISADSIIIIFQHFRYKPFKEDFKMIKEKIKSGHATAIFWDSKLMFIAITKNKELLNKIIKKNKRYQNERKQTAQLEVIK